MKWQLMQLMQWHCIQSCFPQFPCDTEQASSQVPESGPKVNESGRGTTQTRRETRGCLQTLLVYKW